MKKILYVGSECMPFAATGGLGDVMGSLPAALKAQWGEDADIRVVMPLYEAVSAEWRAKMKTEAIFDVTLGWRSQYCGVLSLEKDGVTYYFIDNEYYFKRKSLYGHFDDGERFAFFSMAAVQMMGHLGYYPDILHANDWQCALSVVYLSIFFKRSPGYDNIKTVFTIHNIEYQGRYNMDILNSVFGIPWTDAALMECGGGLNLMKAAIMCADQVTTVSPRYAEEIQTPDYGFGLDPILRMNSFKLCGILNGIDYVYNDPQKDKDIAKKFTWRSLAGKLENKKALQRELGLPEGDTPMFSMVTRLVSHKGVDLVTAVAHTLMSNNDVQLVVLGTGDEQFENFFRWLEGQFPDKVRALITYDRKLSKRIYAATDFFLMPSKSEACGLSQMIASRYGAVPITRETGGLYDSIKGYWVDKGEIKGNGFTFQNYSAIELYDRIQAALTLWADETAMKKFRQKIMRIDFSWQTSAKSYAEVYDKIL